MEKNEYVFIQIGTNTTAGRDRKCGT